MTDNFLGYGTQAFTMYPNMMPAGAFGNFYWREFIDMCQSHWAYTQVAQHFSDMSGPEFCLVLGGLFERHHENGDILKGRKGFVSVGMGRNPKRYTATVYIPIEEWYDRSVEDTHYIQYVVDACDEVFEEVMRRASKTKGRLVNSDNTRSVWNDFVAKARAFKPTVPDPEKWELERRRAVRRNLIPDQRV